MGSIGGGGGKGCLSIGVCAAMVDEGSGVIPGVND